MRDNIILLGANHTRTPIAIRERFSLTAEAQLRVLTERPAKFHELVILSTCNRTEFFLASQDCDAPNDALAGWVSDLIGATLSELAAATYSLSGRDAVAHLFTVSSGLDSMVLGEPHILGQVKTAFERAMSAKAAGPILSRLGQDAIRVGKQVRTQTGLARNRQSIPHVAVDLALKHCNRPVRKVVVIGTGEMGTLSAKVLRSSGVDDLVVTNRDESRGNALALTVNARFASLSRLRAEIQNADMVISAIETNRFIIEPADVDVRDQQVVFIDLGMPRTIDPAVGAVPGVLLFDIDDLERGSEETRELAATDVDAARLMIEAACDGFQKWSAARESAPAIAALTQEAEQIRRGELERALRKLDHLSDRDKNVVAALSVGIVNKLLHQPVSTLRTNPEETAEAIRTLFHLDLAPANSVKVPISADSPHASAQAAD